MSKPADMALAKIMALYDWPAAKADAAKPIWHEALGRYSGDTVAKGLRDVLMAWKGRQAPSPAHVAEACARYHRLAYQALPSPSKPMVPDCKICGDRGAIMMYRDAGPSSPEPWLSRDWGCGHSTDWRKQRNVEGWYTLAQLPAQERYRATGQSPLAGQIGATINRIGDAMAKRCLP